MVIDTGKRTIRIQSLKQIFVIVLVIVGVLCFYAPIRYWLDEHNVPFRTILIVLLVLYIGYRLYFRVRVTSYVYFSDTDIPGMLRFRHFPIKPFSPKQYAIEFQQAELYRYETTRSWYGLREKLTLWQRRGNQIFKYPSFSITILRRHERAALLQALDAYKEKE